MAERSGEDAESLNTYTLLIKPEAEADILEAYQYYEDKAEGLGGDFGEEVNRCLAYMEQHPTMYAAVYKDVQRGLLNRFPYGLIYRVEGNAIVILACFHASRDPKSWRERIQ